MVASKGQAASGTGSGGRKQISEKEPAGALAAIEKHATEEGGKMQVTLDASQAAHQSAHKPSTPRDVSAIQKAYLQARKLRKVYSDTELHVTALQLIFSLMLLPNGTLDTRYMCVRCV